VADDDFTGQLTDVLVGWVERSETQPFSNFVGSRNLNPSNKILTKFHRTDNISCYCLTGFYRKIHIKKKAVATYLLTWGWRIQKNFLRGAK